MKNKLPINIPPCVANQHVAFNMVVMLSNPIARNYLYNHFIELACPKNYKIDNDFYIDFRNGQVFNNEHIAGHYIDKSEFKNNYHNIIKMFIEQKRYVGINGVDVYYLEGGQGYGEYHFPHDTLIFGFDDEKEEYDILSYKEDVFFW